MVSREEDLWKCVMCGKIYGKHDMWFDGDICGGCHQELMEKKKTATRKEPTRRDYD